MNEEDVNLVSETLTGLIMSLERGMKKVTCLFWQA